MEPNEVKVQPDEKERNKIVTPYEEKEGLEPSKEETEVSPEDAELLRSE